MGIWNRNVGAFDIGRGDQSYLLASPPGVSTTPLVSYTAKRTGTYYVSVEAPDLPTANDPTVTPDVTIDAEISYSLQLRKNKTSRK